MPAGNFVFNAGKKGWVSDAAGANFDQWNIVTANNGYRLLFLTSGAAAILDAAGAEDELVVGDLTGILAFEHPANVVAPADGYLIGGMLLAGRTVGLDTANDRAELFANNISLVSLEPGGTITDFLLYYENGNVCPGAANAGTLAGVPIARYDVSGSNLVGASTAFTVKWAGNTGSAGRVLKLS